MLADESAPDSSEAAYFYLSKIQRPSSISRCVQTSFTCSPGPRLQEESKLCEQAILEADQPNSAPSFQLDQNIIFAQSDQIRIFTVRAERAAQAQDGGAGAMQLHCEFSVNDRILDILPVPTDQFDGPASAVLAQRALKKEEKQSAGGMNPPGSHMLFVLTANLHCMLFGYNMHAKRVDLISKGFLRDQASALREPPHPLFLSHNKKFIILMLYDNVLKVIPILKNSASRIQLAHAFDVRIMHPEINMVVPLAMHRAAKATEQSIGVFATQKTGGSGRAAKAQRKQVVHHYLLDFSEHELAADGRKAVELASGQVYHIEPLPFPGFLALDPEFLYLFLGPKDDKQQASCADAKKLRRSMVVSSIISVDQYDPATGRTTDGSNRLRYLAGTEAGELYMIAVNLNLVQAYFNPEGKAAGGGLEQENDESQLVCMEFLGARLSSCSSLLYLGAPGYLYYASNSGDSYVLKIKSEPAQPGSKDTGPPEEVGINPPYNEELGAVDRPYITIVEEHQCLAPLFDIAMKKPPSFSQGRRAITSNGSDGSSGERSRQQRNEILVLSGSNNTSHINIIQNGISIKDHLVLESIPQVYAKGGLFCAGDKIFVRVFGQMQLLVARVVMKQALVVQEMDVAGSLLKVENMESILLIQEVECADQNVGLAGDAQPQPEKPPILLVSDLHIKLFSNDLQSLLYEESKPAESFDCFTHCDLSGSSLLVSTLSDSVTLYDITGHQLTQQDSLDFDAEITALCLNQDASTAVIAVNDAPDYHIHIVAIRTVETGKKLETIQKKSMMQVMEQDLFESLKVTSMLSRGDLAGQSSLVDINEDDGGSPSGAVVQMMNTYLPSLAVKSVKIISTVDDDVPSRASEQKREHIICAFSDGRILTLCALNQQTEDDHKMVHHIGTIEPALCKLVEATGNKSATESVLVSCDRPALFYLDGDGERLQIQYLCEEIVDQAGFVQINDGLALLAYSNSQNKIVLGSMEPKTKLQNRRIGFRKQVQKVVSLDGTEPDLVLASIEEPDFGYLDPSKPGALNMLALISKQTFKTIDIFTLERSEIVNCIHQVSKQISGLAQQQWHQKSHYGSSRHQSQNYILVGTAYLGEATMPSNGRLLIFKVQPKLCRLQPIQSFPQGGAVQAMGTLLANHKYLALAINNRVDLFLFNLRYGDNFDLVLQDQRAAGSYTVALKTSGNQIVVGDLMKGLIVLDVKEQSHLAQSRGTAGRATLSEGPSSSHCNVWVNDVLVLAANRYLVVDKERNILIFERQMQPTNEIERFKLRTVAQINFGEEITSAVLGSLTSKASSGATSQSRRPAQKAKAASKSAGKGQGQGKTSESPSALGKSNTTGQATLMRKKNRKVNQEAGQEGAPASISADAGPDVFDNNVRHYVYKLNPSHDFIRQLCTIALFQLQDMQQLDSNRRPSAPRRTSAEEAGLQTVLFGSVDGSIGQLQAIPKFTFMFLKRLHEVMEHHVQSLSRITVREQRQVRFEDRQPDDPQNIIDGGFIEQFLYLNEELQSKILSNMLLNQRDMCKDYLMQVRQLVQVLQQMH